MHGYVTLFNSTVIVPLVRRGDLIESCQTDTSIRDAISSDTEASTRWQTSSVSRGTGAVLMTPARAAVASAAKGRQASIQPEITSAFSGVSFDGGLD